MQTIQVTKIIKAPIEAVFDAYTDHERLADLPMVISAKVVKPGTIERNGLGAVRVVNGGVLVLREEITGFERPHLMEYKIVESRPKSKHELGRVEFSEVPGGTKVVWTTVFSVPLPVVGSHADLAFALAFRTIFRMTLAQVAKRAIAATGRAK